MTKRTKKVAKVSASGRTTDAEEIGRAMTRAVRAAMIRHALLGEKVAYMKNGKIVEEIPKLPKGYRRPR